MSCFIRSMEQYNRGNDDSSLASSNASFVKSESESESEMRYDSVSDRGGIDLSKVGDARFHAEAYAMQIKTSILKDDTRDIDKLMDIDDIAAILNSTCVACGREHVPGENAVNGMDRRFNHVRIYDKDKVDPLCTNCNMIKSTNDSAESTFISLHLQFVKT